MSSRYSITDIFEQFGTSVKQQGRLHAEQLKVLELIRQCRTGALGSHKERCTGCGHTKVHYNSCGNRHCPNCQGVNRERWLLKRAEDLESENGVSSASALHSPIGRYRCGWELEKLQRKG